MRADGGKRIINGGFHLLGGRNWSYAVSHHAQMLTQLLGSHTAAVIYSTFQSSEPTH